MLLIIPGTICVYVVPGSMSNGTRAISYTYILRTRYKQPALLITTWYW